MEQFAVIGLDTQEKKAEAERLLKELGYRGDDDWNKSHKNNSAFKFIVSYEDGSYNYHSHNGDNAPIQPDPLKEVVEDIKAQIAKVDSVKYPDRKQWMGNLGVLLTPNEAKLILEALEKPQPK